MKLSNLPKCVSGAVPLPLRAAALHSPAGEEEGPTHMRSMPPEAKAKGHNQEAGKAKIRRRTKSLNTAGTESLPEKENKTIKGHHLKVSY